MECNYIFLVAGFLCAFAGGFLVMYFIHLSKKFPEGTIVIEEYPEGEADLFRFDLPLELDDIKTAKKIIFNVHVEKNASSMMQENPD